MLTNENLLIERAHPGGLGGVQRIYKFKNGNGLSVVNSPMLHVYPFAWEAAVITGVDDEGDFEGLTYNTELTDGVEVFSDDNEANEFIKKAENLFGNAGSF